MEIECAVPGTPFSPFPSFHYYIQLFIMLEILCFAVSLIKYLTFKTQNFQIFHGYSKYIHDNFLSHYYIFFKNQIKYYLQETPNTDMASGIACAQSSFCSHT